MILANNLESILRQRATSDTLFDAKEINFIFWQLIGDFKLAREFMNINKQSIIKKCYRENFKRQSDRVFFNAIL